MPKPTKRKSSRSEAHADRIASGRPAAAANKRTEQTQPKERVTSKEDHAEELRFKVTTAFKQNFKQVAKDLGIKKAALLETLLAEWQARRATSGKAAKPVPRKGPAPPATTRPARAAKPRSHAT
jgi:hypothetical protein